MDKHYNVYLVKNSELFQAVLDKIQAARPGELIPLTPEEYSAWGQAIRIKKMETTRKCPRCNSDLEVTDFPFEGDLRCTKCKRTFRPEEEHSIHSRDQEERKD